MSNTFQKIEPESWRPGPSRVARAYRDRKHVPYNKRAGEVAASAVRLTVVNCSPNENNDGWLSVELEETTTSHKGVVQSRTISVVLPPSLRDDLIGALTKTPQGAGSCPG